jgi:L-iditol 2-dehydrogenase
VNYPATSRAAVLTDYRQPLQVREFAVPSLEPDAILVKVEACTMCGTDVHMADGDFAAVGHSHVPLIMGHEIIGKIVALGPQRTTDSLNRRIAVGDRIAWAYGWCDRCYWCTIAKQPTLCENQRMYGWGPCDVAPYLTGGYAEYCYVMPICKTVRVPDELDSRVAASATCAFRTVVHAFEELGALKPTDTVVVQGTGPVGLYALAYALTMGAREVICIGAPAERLAIANRFGAAVTLDVLESTVEERRTLILERTGGRGADVVVECSGPTAAFEEGWDLIRLGGKYLVIGQAERKKAQILAPFFNQRQITVLGTISADVSHYYRALEFLVTHADRYDFEALLGNTYGLDQVNDAIASMRAGLETKPVILPHAA